MNLFKVNLRVQNSHVRERNCSHHVSNISKALLYTLCRKYIFNFKGSIFKSGNTIGPFSRQWCLFRGGLAANLKHMGNGVSSVDPVFWVVFFKGHLWTALLFQKGEQIRGVFFLFFFKVPKNNIEHEHDGLEDDFSFQTGLVSRFYVNFCTYRALSLKLMFF